MKLAKLQIIQSTMYPNGVSIRPPKREINIRHYLQKAGFRPGESVYIIDEEAYNNMFLELEEIEID